MKECGIHGPGRVKLKGKLPAGCSIHTEVFRVPVFTDNRINLQPKIVQLANRNIAMYDRKRILNLELIFFSPHHTISNIRIGFSLSIKENH